MRRPRAQLKILKNVWPAPSARGFSELLENPLAEIDDPPSHDPVNRWDRPTLEDRSQRRPMLVVQPRRLPRRLAVDQTVPAGRRRNERRTGDKRAACWRLRRFTTVRVELEHPVTNDLKADAADLRRLGARGPAAPLRHSHPEDQSRPPCEPPSVRLVESNFSRFGNPPLEPAESASARTGISSAYRLRNRLAEIGCGQRVGIEAITHRTNAHKAGGDQEAGHLQVLCFPAGRWCLKVVGPRRPGIGADLRREDRVPRRRAIVWLAQAAAVRADSQTARFML